MAYPTKLWVILRFLMVFAFLSVMFSCGNSGSEDLGKSTISQSGIQGPRLIILYAPCTVNKNYLSPYNKNIPFTPNLKHFAENAVVFTRHQTEAGQSGIAYASIFSGAQADRHGVYRHPVKLEDDMYLISEAYAENGYETFFWNIHKMAGMELNYGQGVKQQNTFQRYLTAGDPRFKSILEKLEDDEHYKAFIMTNFTVTHGPYRKQPLQRFLERYPSESKGIIRKDISKYYELYRKNRLALQWNFPEAVRRLGLSEAEILKLSEVVELVYKANVSELDRLFGKVIAAVSSNNLLDKSLIVFTADHGEILYRENALFKWSHAMQLTPEAINVPLIIHSSHIKSGVYERVSRSIDVFPTMMGLSEISIPPEKGIQGVNLHLALMDRQQRPDLLAYSHSSVLVRSVFLRMQDKQKVKDWAFLKKFFPSEDVKLIWVSVRDGDFVYKIRNIDGSTWGVEVFNLAKDSTEFENLYDPMDPKHKKMVEKLKDYKSLLVKNYLQSKGEQSNRSLPEKEEIEALRSLGYIK